MACSCFSSRLRRSCLVNSRKRWLLIALHAMHYTTSIKHAGNPEGICYMLNSHHYIVTDNVNEICMVADGAQVHTWHSNITVYIHMHIVTFDGIHNMCF